MSRGSRLSIMGLYNYNPEIFEGLTVPTGIDRDVVINEILMQCGELELVYPSYTFMKMAIGNWSKMEAKIWDKLWNTENITYNPIWNVDGEVVDSIIRSGDNSENTQSSVNGNGTRTGSTKGYNEVSWLDNEKDVNNNTQTGSGSTSGEWSDTETHTTTRTGNIGVTTTQQMIREERDVADFSTMKYIVNSFKKRFCVMIY